MIPIVTSVSNFTELSDLGTFQMIPDFDGVFFQLATNDFVPFRAVDIPDGKNAYKINHGNILAGNAASLELENTNADYQTSGAATVVLIIQGSSTTVTDFEIFEGDTANATTTTKEDFPSVSLGNLQHITSKNISIATSKYITVQANTGNIAAVYGWVIE